MPKYRVRLDVVSASGWQEYSVEASSPKEALKKVQDGYGFFEDEDIEISGIQYPDVDEVELVEE